MDATFYVFLLLIVSLLAYFTKFLLTTGHHQKKREDSLQEPASGEGIVKKEASSSTLRSRNAPPTKQTWEVSLKDVTETKQPLEETSTKEAQPAKVAQETMGEAKEAKEAKATQEAKEIQEAKKIEKVQEAKKDEAAQETDVKEGGAEEPEKGEEGDDVDEDEDEDDEDDDEDEDEDEEKDLHEVITSGSVVGKSIAACVSLQGKRPNNEDRSVIEGSLDAHKNMSIFGIFDGHDGNKASEYCAKFLVKNIVNQKGFATSTSKAITAGFGKTDKKFLDKTEPGGCTAIVALLKQEDGKKPVLFVANVGDSRCVASVGGKAVALSTDHKPDLPEEEKRIKATDSHQVQQSVEIVQGKRTKISRIDGTLAVSRAMGDGDFKDERDKSPAEQAVSSVPEIQTIELTSEHEFIILACDGLWDVLSNQEAIDFVKNKISSTSTPQDLVTITKALVSHAIDDLNSTDNVTALIVKF